MTNKKQTKNLFKKVVKTKVNEAKEPLFNEGGVIDDEDKLYLAYDYDIPHDNSDDELEELQVQSDDEAYDDQLTLTELNREFRKNIDKGIEESKNSPIFQFGLMQMIAKTTDPTALILES